MMASVPNVNKERNRIWQGSDQTEFNVFEKPEQHRHNDTK